MAKKNKIVICVLLALELLSLILTTFLHPFAALGDPVSRMLEIILTRGLGGALFLYLMAISGTRVLNPLRLLPGVWVPDLILPVLIVVNNLPLEALFRGEGWITQPGYTVALLVLECLCIGLFEECAFRGYFLIALLERFHGSRFQIWLTVLLSSMVFGLMHLLNLAEGADIGSVMQQVGYSMLVGAMCAIVLMLTGNLWIPVLLHAGFDFCGLLLPTLGQGTWFYPLTIWITVGLVLLVGLYLVIRLFRRGMANTFALLPGREDAYAERGMYL